MILYIQSWIKSSNCKTKELHWYTSGHKGHTSRISDYLCLIYRQATEEIKDTQGSIFDRLVEAVVKQEVEDDEDDDFLDDEEPMSDGEKTELREGKASLIESQFKGGIPLKTQIYTFIYTS